MLSVKQVAERLNLSRQCVYTLIDPGEDGWPLFEARRETEFNPPFKRGAAYLISSSFRVERTIVFIASVGIVRARRFT